MFRAAVEGSLLALQSGLRQRAEAAAAREVLELLLDTFHVVSKVEKLIKELPSMLADLSNGDLNSAEKDHLSNGISFQHTENGTNPREAQSMLLERIASEMNRLKFYITHAQYRTCLSLRTWRRGYRMLAYCWMLAWGTVS